MMKLKPFEPRALYPIRSPHENVLRVDYAGRYKYDWFDGRYINSLEQAESSEQAKRIAENIVYSLKKIMVMLHGRGDPIADVAERVVEIIDFTQYLRNIYPDVALTKSALTPDRFSFFAICILLAPDQETLKSLQSLMPIEESERLYPIDVLLKAFMPDWQEAKIYSTKPWTKLAWVKAFTAALASPDKEAGFAKYMGKYECYIKVFIPFKWKPWSRFKVEYTVEGDVNYGNAFHLFAFEVAVAVCAYDLDDSEFRHHPYYPRELVDYYRENIRNTRDAWRTHGVGADIVIRTPPAGKKINLQKSRSKGFKRWLELISDGEADTCKSVIEICGRPKHIRKRQRVFEELSDNNIAVCVDVKDDESLENSLQGLMESRDITGYEPPETEPSGGPGRCQALLDHAIKWMNDSKCFYSLYIVDMQSDSWGAVVVHNDFADEFKTLSKQLWVDLK